MLADCLGQPLLSRELKQPRAVGEHAYSAYRKVKKEVAEAREAKRAAVRVATRAAEADASLAQGIAAATCAGDAAEAKILGSFYDLQLPDSYQRIQPSKQPDRVFK